MKTIEYLVTVAGRLWGGGRGSLRKIMREKPPQKMFGLERMFGDFQMIDDFEVVKVETSRKFAVLRKFSDPDTALLIADNDY